MTCPDYYTLADGEEFADYSERYIVRLAERLGVTDPFVIHCVVSGLEHMYRRGYKTKDMSHDLSAAKYWFDRARKQNHWETCYGRPKSAISDAIDLLCLCVEQERRKKWPDSTD